MSDEKPPAKAGRTKPKERPKRRPKAKPGAEGAPAASGRKLVFIADDDQGLLKLYGRVAKKAGCRVALAKDGIGAARLLKKARPDLILLDNKMPRMDGFELLELLNRYKAASKIPVVFLTDRDDPVELDRALRLGVADYLVKPVSPKQLFNKVRAILK